MRGAAGVGRPNHCKGARVCVGAQARNPAHHERASDCHPSATSQAEAFGRLPAWPLLASFGCEQVWSSQVRKTYRLCVRAAIRLRTRCLCLAARIERSNLWLRAASMTDSGRGGQTGGLQRRKRPARDARDGWRDRRATLREVRALAHGWPRISMQRCALSSRTPRELFGGRRPPAAMPVVPLRSSFA